jgi:uncharacterized protein
VWGVSQRDLHTLALIARSSALPPVERLPRTLRSAGFLADIELIARRGESFRSAAFVEMKLPDFTYHPNPLATGSIEPRTITCACCREQRPYVYTGTVFSGYDLDDSLCPWCIASGLANATFAAEFTDADALVDPFSGPTLPPDVLEELVQRTPGFTGWQQERWLTHCRDACAFVGCAGYEEIVAYGSESLVESLRRDVEMSVEAFASYLESLDAVTGPTAYVFRCLHCGTLVGYSDCS